MGPGSTTTTSIATLPAALWRLARHRWGEPPARRALPGDTLERLAARVAASEQQHTGQIRIVAEASLPWSYLRRQASPRERAIMLFSKYRVWDTEHNNGVLIYLLMPEHAIEIVADRGLNERVAAGTWPRLVAGMSAAFKAGQQVVMYLPVRQIAAAAQPRVQARSSASKTASTPTRRGGTPSKVRRR